MACLDENRNRVCIFDTRTEGRIDAKRSVVLKNAVSESMFVKISKDFSQIVLANMKENYLLKEVGKNRYD